ncbi:MULTISPECIES: hypothetical protein [unclassified Micromonospora]|uniref:hypothetical protein n=1 Tax=unclassified Micromonospora TaxID=2617518 RepID=UPI003A87D2B3
MTTSRQARRSVLRSLLVTAALATVVLVGLGSAESTLDAPSANATCPVGMHWSDEAQMCVQDTHW